MSPGVKAEAISCAGENWNLFQRAARSFARRTFSIWETVGLHVMPVHFYEPIPHTRSLDDAVWDPSTELPGINMNDSFQVDFLHQLSAVYQKAWVALARNGTSEAGRFFLGNGYFDSVDAEILYGIVRRFKPRRIYEIGSGFSTLLTAQAIQDNQEEDSSFTCEFVAIDPFPRTFLQEGIGGVSVLPKRVQDIPISTFAKLECNDILFIDSSHVLAIGSDVRYEYLEILPRLKPGVLIHFHDIFFPAEYPKKWVLNFHRFWNEQYLLQAFLTFNTEFEVLWAGNYMHLNHPDLLASAIPSYKQELGKLPVSIDAHTQLRRSLADAVPVECQPKSF